MSRLYVGNLSFSTTAKGLGEFFSQVGSVANVTIQSRDERSLGYGFVDMGSEGEAQKAVNQLHDQELDGRRLKVEIARPQSDRPSYERRGPRRFNRDSSRPRREVDVNAPLSQTRVHLGNLPFSITEDEVKAAFPGCNVKEVIIIKSYTGRSRGYGFVEFETHADQEKGIKICENLTLNDRQIQCAPARERTE
ncbi:putative 28 kDa ribonucleoprotein, chloroplastic [Blattamonas nauphoetae]|uniref:28 kDa ribonucleoprotein, chloroplastic n=1 Tax=Blattamonas nauphoetae TaxID=2049346 RepID=A0ABQ9Y6Z3_9EUKA|nr:putative 28 kDa ribonucleoprotein, chloroplastic [Blattamonas nauphoetae]